MIPFINVGDTVNLAVTGSSQVLAITGNGGKPGTLRIANIGNQTVFLKFGTSGTTVTTAAGFPLLPNTVEVFDLGSLITHVAAIAASTGSSIYVTTGLGV